MRKFGHVLLALGLFALLSIGFFDVPHSFDMQMQGDGTMGKCLFVNMRDAICTMKFEEHLAQWQSIFTTTAPQKALAFALLLLLAVVFVAVAIFKRNLLLLFSYYVTHWRLYIRHNPELPLCNPLGEAFSQGILNPKIY